MKVNKDLTDAIMMVSLIILVLVGTSVFDSETTKYIIMATLGAIIAAMAALRIHASRQDDQEKAL